MKDFPSESNEFYNLRDDRTNLCVSNRDYQRTRCLVTVDENVLSTYSGQILLSTSCNLLSRWCRNVTVELPAVETHPMFCSKHELLQDYISHIMRGSDPFGNFKVILRETEKPDLQLHIGRNISIKAENHVVVQSSGWLSALSRQNCIDLPEMNDANCLGAIAAACLGVAQTFKYALHYPSELYLAEGILDLFTLQHYNFSEKNLPVNPFPQNAKIGRMLMVGAGSVGSAAIFCLRAINASCELTIVDNDVVKIENFNRSPIFKKHYFNWNKAKAVANYCQDSSIDAFAFKGWWEDFVRQNNRSSNSFDIWLPLANEYNVRWSMQNNYPPLMIHASTTQNWGVNHGRHIPGQGDCLADRFPSVIEKSVLQCSSTPIETAETTIDAALPFLSVLAGVMIAAELSRLQLPQYPQITNFGLLDLGGRFEEVQLLNKSPRPNCICKSQSLAVFRELNGHTAYSYFTLT